MTRIIRWTDTALPSMLAWDPWRMFAPLDTASTWPAYDVVESPDALVVTMDVPGLGESDVTVTVAGRTLSIAASAARRSRTATRPT
jgi:HSP20 family molecular chaperone IbpA